MTRSVSLLFILMFLLMQDTFGQTFSGESRFQRQLDAVLWNFDSNIDYQQKGFELSLFNRMQSRFFLLNQQARNPQDEHQGNLVISNWLNDYVALTTEMRTFTLRNTNIKQDVLLGGIKVNPWQNLMVKTQAGFMNDVRGENPDQGLALHFSAWSPSLRLTDELLIKPDFLMDYGNINPRQYLTHRYVTDIILNQELFTLEGRFQYGRSKRESYQSSSFLNISENNFVESIQTDTSLITMNLRVPLSPKWNSRIDVSALNNIRKVENNKIDESDTAVLFDSKSLRQRLDMGFSVDRVSLRYFVRSGMNYSITVRESRLMNTDDIPADQVRRRAEILQNSNFSQSRLELYSDNRIDIGSRHRISVFASTSIMRYDTPESNFDDRDEFSFLFRIRNEHRFSEYFRGNLTLAGEGYHYVYLFSERSIENNWRRSIRMVPEFFWEPHQNFYIRQVFLIRANYTVEDYEIAGRPKNDQVSRELVLQTDMEYRLAPGWVLQASGSRSELRIGKLFWKTFQETPIDTLITYDATVQITRQIGQILISSGVRYFLKTDFLSRATNTITVNQPDGSITTISRVSTGQQRTIQWGPVVTISMPFSQRNVLYISGWYQQQFITERLYITYPEEYRNAFLRAERKASKRIFPNLEIRVKFRF